jgi:hypothetical protein
MTSPNLSSNARGFFGDIGVPFRVLTIAKVRIAPFVFLEYLIPKHRNAMGQTDVMGTMCRLNKGGRIIANGAESDVSSKHEVMG